MIGRKSIIAVLAPVLAAGVVSAQTVSTEILGLVTDGTRAVLPGATVLARRVATGDVRSTKSNETGNYIFPLLEIGEYEVTCSATALRPRCGAASRCSSNRSCASTSKCRWATRWRRSR